MTCSGSLRGNGSVYERRPLRIHQGPDQLLVVNRKYRRFC